MLILIVDSHAAPSNFSQHYLQVQALTPVSETTASAPTASTISVSVVTYPLLIFISILTIGFIAFLASRLKNKSYLGNTLKLALVLAIVPLGLAVVGIQTQLTSKAGPDEIPISVSVNQVTSTGFQVEFFTKSASNTAARVSSTQDMKSIIMTRSESIDKKSSRHQFIFKLLSPNTTYYLEIYSEGIWYQDNGHPLTIRTSP